MNAPDFAAALAYVACEEPNGIHLSRSTLEALAARRMFTLCEARELRVWCTRVAEDVAFPWEGSYLCDALGSRRLSAQRRAALDWLRMHAEAVIEMARETA